MLSLYTFHIKHYKIASFRFSITNINLVMLLVNLPNDQKSIHFSLYEPMAQVCWTSVMDGSVVKLPLC